MYDSVVGAKKTVSERLSNNVLFYKRTVRRVWSIVSSRRSWSCVPYLLKLFV